MEKSIDSLKIRTIEFNKFREKEVNDTNREILIKELNNNVILDRVQAKLDVLEGLF